MTTRNDQTPNTEIVWALIVQRPADDPSAASRPYAVIWLSKPLQARQDAPRPCDHCGPDITEHQCPGAREHANTLAENLSHHTGIVIEVASFDIPESWSRVRATFWIARKLADRFRTASTGTADGA